MRILLSLLLALAALVTVVATASAQSLIILAFCAHNDPAGPTFSSLQVSERVRMTCMTRGEEFPDFCMGIADLSAAAGTGMACAEAIGDQYLFGVEKTFIAVVAPRPPEVRPANDRGRAGVNVPPEPVFQHKETDLQFILESADRSVDLVGCDMFGAAGPAATYVQKSDPPNGDAAGLSCADALQDSLDLGAVLSADGGIAIAPTPHPGVRHQQGRVILDSDFNEMRPAEFVIVHVGQWTMGAP